MGRPARECGAFFILLWGKDVYMKNVSFFCVFKNFYINLSPK